MTWNYIAGLALTDTTRANHTLLYDDTVVDQHPVFDWSDTTMKMLKTCQVGTSSVPLSLEEKQLVAVSYLTEVVYMTFVFLMETMSLVVVVRDTRVWGW
jgi:hypothetical protein